MTGRKRKVKFADVIEVFLSRDDQFEPLTSREIAEVLGVSRKTAYNRLKELSERGGLRSKKTGAKGRVWWPDPDIWYPETSQLELRNRRVDAVLERLEGSATLNEDEEVPPIIDRELTQIEFPGEGNLVDRRREAIRRAYLQLAQLGEADRQDILEGVDIDPEDLGYRDLDSFWNNLVLKHSALSQLSGVVAPPEGGRYYRHIDVQ